MATDKDVWDIVFGMGLRMGGEKLIDLDFELICKPLKICGLLNLRTEVQGFCGPYRSS